MLISKTTRAIALGAAASAAALAPATVAKAQPQTCPAAADPVALDVTSPIEGASVTGRVEVKGRFDGPLAVFQVELFVGDSRKDAVNVEPPAESGSFTLGWDTAGAAGGPATLSIVACGGAPSGGTLVRGDKSLKIEVVATPAPPSETVVLKSVRARSDDDDAKPWVALAMGGPGLLGLGYALGVRPARHRSHVRSGPAESGSPTPPTPSTSA